VRFFHPRAEAVRLRIQGRKDPIEMNEVDPGVWEVQVPQDIASLDGLRYEFDLDLEGDETMKGVADPFADRTEYDRGGEIRSYFSDTSYRWTDAGFRVPTHRDLVIYETQVAALSRHPSSGVSEKQRGTFVGAASRKIRAHLKRMGVAAQFMPVHASDPEKGKDWRYFTTSYRAFAGDLARNRKRTPVEFKQLVDKLHGEGTPVILDVVFNHGGELLVRAMGEDVLYRKLDDGSFDNGSGVGPTLATEHPIVRETVIQSLENLVEDYHVDGFRFDLGALHDLDTMVEIDRRLPKKVFLTSEPWAISNTKWGKGDMTRRLKKTRWTIWNDDFREPARALVAGRSDSQSRDRLKIAIKGSLAADGGWAARPQQSINYLTSHDGHTLADLHQGGPQRQLLGLMLLLTSQGIPMIAEGSEFMHSKGANEDNTYDKPHLNQLNWEKAKQHETLVEATSRLIELRKALPHFKHARRLAEGRDITFINPTGYPEADNTNAIGYVLRPPKGARVRKNEKELVVLVNGGDREQRFWVPEGRWRVIADGALMQVDRKGLANRIVKDQEYIVPPGAGVILAPE
jgi:pullulanase